MSYRSTAVHLRCWKCRKFVANSGSIINNNECNQALEILDQEACNIWHLEAEASPEWIKREIEKEHWTTGKLHCPYCRTRLGAFNFVDSTKCSCGRLAVIRLSKSKIDVDITVKTPCQASSASKFYTYFDKKFTIWMSELANRNWIMDRYVAVPGTLVDALCLEVPEYDKYLEPSGKKPCITFNLKKNDSVLREQKANFCRNVLHRKSNSMDLDTTEKLPLKSYMNRRGTFTLKQNPSEVPLLSSVSAGCNIAYNNRHMFDVLPRSSKLRSRFSETPHNRVGPGVSRTEESPSLSSAGLPNTSVRSTTGGEGHMTPVEIPAQIMQPSIPNSSSENQRLNKREINKLKNLRRKQRKREKWLLGQKQINKPHHIAAEDDDELAEEKERYTCAVCLDVYFNPYMCYPCRHIFCEPCLRTLARDNPTRTPCPLCRSIISRVHFHSDLSKCSVAFFPNEYLKRKQSFQRANCAKWPLPNCNRLFRVFGDFRRHMDPMGRRHFPHGEHRDDFGDGSRGWRFDLDMIIIYIYSVNWIIGFILFCLLCYFFFLSL
ncbi:E3 ubiquitin-protein ligase RNF180 [Hyla sarda]|uniref:E3 ubiquitin-protein ligase RNF180 n=1 Tax=Hyla sarda TaxID=327740 RepID=UPI0024C41F12|nr:E3 ubiquitin-protein ligase RNF180 [Hyla sarda]